MGPTGARIGSDLEPVHGTCDICGHPHACYVGGRPTYGAAGDVVLWERQVCLGCLMRATSPDGFDAFADCLVPPSATGEGPHHV